MRKNLQTYQKVDVESNLLAADPHQVISMMYDGLINSISMAKGAIERKDLAVKSKMLTKSVNILTALQNSLDKESEPAISDNFFNLYQYCIDVLNDVSVTLDVAKIDEINGLLKPLRDAWKDMSEEGKQEGMERIRARDEQDPQTMSL